jgi:two-component system, NarL family, sensor kinase
MDVNSEFIVLFSISTVAMLMLAGSIVLFVVFYQKRMIEAQLRQQAMEHEHQEKMMKAELESQESERRRLSADLHDSIGGMLSTIRVGISTIGRSLPNPAAVDETKKMLDDTISSVRRISRDLMPATLDKFGMVHALKELCERFEATSLIQVEFVEPVENFSLDPQRELMVFRIVQELVNNAVKHAQANRICVSLQAEKMIVITVEDDGIGFNPEEFKNNKEGKGLGLYNIENRARLLGGTIEFVRPSIGSKTVLTLPPQHETAH